MPVGTQAIQVATSTGSRDLFSMKPDGTAWTQITHTPTDEYFPKWAPAW